MVVGDNSEREREMMENEGDERENDRLQLIDRQVQLFPTGNLKFNVRQGIKTIRI